MFSLTSFTILLLIIKVQFSSVHFSSVQSLSHVRLFAIPWIAARQASLSITNSRSSLRLTSIESVMPSGHLILCFWTISSVQFSCSVVSDSLWPHESQHARPRCPSPTPGVPPNSRASSWWCHPAISSSVVPFSSCPQSLPASESFPMSQLFAWGGQSTRVSASASFPPKKSQG